MKSIKDPQSELEARQTRNAYGITVALMIAVIPTAGLFAYFGSIYNQPQLFIISGTLLATFFFTIYPLVLISNGRKNLAMMLVILSFLINVMIVPLIVQGLGFIVAFSILLVILSIVGFTLASYYSTSGIVLALITGAIAVLLDNFLPAERIQIPELGQFSPYIVAAVAIPIFIILIREFNRLSLQSKITLGILLTGGITVATLVLFGVNRFNFINAALQSKYQANISTKLENQISSTIDSEAGEINNLLSELQSDVKTLAGFRSNLNNQQLLLPNGSYWNATEKISQLPNGQLGNRSSEPSSIYIPNTIPLSESMVADLNTSIYLDLLAPGFLESHPEAAAIYFISDLGYTIYYPNINLAENVPPDFDPTQQSFFTIAEPANNPEKSPKWTRPYQDPAGTGLIVTVSVPVYNGNKFVGVMSADILLNRVTQIVSQINIGGAGIPILVDEKGTILAMTADGYTYFGLEPEVVSFNESPKQTIYDSSVPELQEISLKITGSQTGLSKFSVAGVDTYLSTATLDVPGYKLAFIAPVSELNKEIDLLRAEVDAELTQTMQDITVILTVLFIGAFITSLVVGQIITRPMTRLTETVKEIAGGNLASRAIVETGDETGVLAQSFNSMTDRLTETLQGLENRILERTSELEKLSQTNAYRASLFESISRISQIINNTRVLDQLLPQITETISSQLGFYHVGIFLSDVHKEYAILVAANSEGGKVMLARNHRLKIGETGIVGYVAQSGTPRVALDVGQDLVYFNNPDLPETHSEIALPLRSGTEIIGALDVQSKMINAFTEEDVNILSVLADQVSIAIQNAQSFQNSLEALEKAERAAAQLSEQQWSQFHSSQKLTGFHFDGVITQEAKPNPKNQFNNVSIPIVSRGIQIGTLKLSTADPDRKWDNNEIAMLQATAERTALAIETARLLQEAQKRASKERAIGQISAKIGNLVNIENIVQTTIQELGDTLPGTDVAIQFTSGNTG